MINFQSKPFEWNNMNMLMENVDLSKIEFLKSNTISFELLNCYDGRFYKKLICHNVWKFISENNFQRDESFAVFICDIKTALLEQTEIEDAFSYIQYGFKIPASSEYTLLCMDSGEVSITLICENIEICTVM